ncbi:protein retrieval receptor [Martiniozyma asiatica (nom. inval.)]|nr:protein retrieval receptor [Martiniozyma asiatica]
MDLEEDNQRPWDPYVDIFNAKARIVLDIITPHVISRWIGTYFIIFAFMARIVLVEGWYIICYSWAIFILNMFLKFLTPKFDPSLEQDMTEQSIEEGTQLMDEKDDEFKPFIRRLPEFVFWKRATISTAIALVCSFIPVLDIPVFWPILVAYFVLLFFLTMRRQIQHMIKFRYVPFDLGKIRYK